MIPLTELETEGKNKGHFTASREFTVTELAIGMGKWPHEFDELPSMEQARILAYLEDKNLMDAWHRKQAEKEAEEEAKKREREANRRGRR